MPSSASINKSLLGLHKKKAAPANLQQTEKPRRLSNKSRAVYRNAIDRDAVLVFLFFLNDTATTEIYTLSLHDALPISTETTVAEMTVAETTTETTATETTTEDRKSTRLNSSHGSISYAVFCLQKT